MATVQACALFALTTLARARFLAEPSRERPSVEVYAINLDDRVDKCQCMQRQLKDSPWPVHRFSAIDRNSVYDKCPFMISFPEAMRGTNATRVKETTAALACSNLLIMEKFFEESSADYLLTFEDDAVIVDDSIWDPVSNFLEAPCTTLEYMMFDPFGDGHGEDLDCKSFAIDYLTPTTWGSHMQLVNRSVIPQLISRARTTPVCPQDLAAGCARVHQKLAVRANVVKQARFWNAKLDGPFPCSETVETTWDRRGLVAEEMPFQCKGDVSGKAEPTDHQPAFGV